MNFFSANLKKYLRFSDMVLRRGARCSGRFDLGLIRAKRMESASSSVRKPIFMGPSRNWSGVMVRYLVSYLMVNTINIGHPLPLIRGDMFGLTLKFKNLVVGVINFKDALVREGFQKIKKVIMITSVGGCSQLFAWCS